MQPLVNAYRRSYPDKDAGAAFHAFPAARPFEVPVRPGAVAYRFVLAATGQETALVQLGVVTVG